MPSRRPGASPAVAGKDLPSGLAAASGALVMFAAAAAIILILLRAR
jgi:hypothetical protein